MRHNCQGSKRKDEDNRKATQMKFYKMMAVSLLLCGYKIWTLRKHDINRIQSVEINAQKSKMMHKIG